MSKKKMESGKVASVTMSPAAEAVLRKQQEIVELEQRMDKVVAAHMEQGQQAARLKADLPDMNKLNREFDELLAKHLTGEATDEEVKLYQNRVEAAKKAWEEAGPKVEAIARMMNVLQQRQEDMATQGIELRKEKTTLVNRLIHAEAEAECERYVEAARTVGDAYRRMVGLSLILRINGLDRPLHAHAPMLFIPRWHLPACMAEPNRGGSSGALFDGSFEISPQMKMELVTEIKQRLQDDIGVEFDV